MKSQWNNPGIITKSPMISTGTVIKSLMKSPMKSPGIVMKCCSSLSASYEIIIGNLMNEIHRQLMKPFHCRVWHYTHSSAGKCLFIIIKVVTTSRRQWVSKEETKGPRNDLLVSNTKVAELVDGGEWWGEAWERIYLRELHVLGSCDTQGPRVG